MNALVESWGIHNRINLYLLDAIPEEALGSVSASKGRAVGQQIAHIHNVRCMWLKSADPALLAGLHKFENDDPTKSALRAGLTASGEAIGKLIDAALAGDGRIKGFKPHATAFFAYLIVARIAPPRDRSCSR